jgi:hypothetical protein
MRPAHDRDETLLREAAGTRQRGSGTVGGRRFPTDRRLHVIAHGFSGQTGKTGIPLVDILRRWRCWTRLFNVVPLLPHSLAVETGDGAGHCFVPQGRKPWARAIHGTAATAGSLNGAVTGARWSRKRGVAGAA